MRPASCCRPIESLIKIAGLLLLLFYGNTAFSAGSTTTATMSVAVTDQRGQSLSSAMVEWSGGSRYGGEPFEAARKVGADAPFQIPLEVGRPVYLKISAPGKATEVKCLVANGTAVDRPVKIALPDGVTVRGRFFESKFQEDGSDSDAATDDLATSKPVELTSATATAIFYLFSKGARQGRLGNYITERETQVTTVPVNSDGSFTMEHLAPGEYHIRLNAKQYSSRSYQFEENLTAIASDTSNPIAIPCTRLGFLAGQATDEKGNPVADTSVVAKSDYDWRIHFGEPCKTDAAGYFKLEGIPDIPWHLEISSQKLQKLFRSTGRGINVSDVTFVELDEPNETAFNGGSTETLSLKHVSSARVFDGITQEPLAEFKAELVNPPSWKRMEIVYGPKGTGKFSVRSSSYIGQQPVRVSVRGLVPLTKELSDSGTVPFTLQSPAELSGIVIDAATKKPLPDVKFWSETYARDFQTTTDKEGRFSFPAYPAGVTDHLIFDAGERFDRWTETIHLQPDTFTSLTIALKPNHPFHIQLVQDPGGAPLAGEEFQSGGGIQESGRGLRGVRVLAYGNADANGRLTTYSPNETLRLWLPSRQLAITIPRQPGANETSRTIRLGSGSVKLKLATNHVLFDAIMERDGVEYVYSSDNFRQEYRVATDALGRAELQDLPAGNWTARVRGGRWNLDIVGEYRVNIPVEGDKDFGELPMIKSSEPAEDSDK